MRMVGSCDGWKLWGVSAPRSWLLTSPRVVSLSLKKKRRVWERKRAREGRREVCFSSTGIIMSERTWKTKDLTIFYIIDHMGLCQSQTREQWLWVKSSIRTLCHTVMDDKLVKRKTNEPPSMFFRGQRCGALMCGSGSRPAWKQIFKAATKTMNCTCWLTQFSSVNK